MKLAGSVLIFPEGDTPAPDRSAMGIADAAWLRRTFLTSAKHEARTDLTVRGASRL